MIILLGDDPGNTNSYTTFQSGDAEVDAEEAIFVELIQTLLKEPAEREHFYQVRKLHMYFKYHSRRFCMWLLQKVLTSFIPGGFSNRIWSQL